MSSTITCAARFTAPPDGPLDPAMQAAYARDGFLILEGFLDQPTCDALQDRIARLVADFDPATTRTVFSTKTQAHARDRYFLESGGAIRFFLEDGALDEGGGLAVAKELALNKIGHALHDLDPVFAKVSRSPRIAALAAAVGPAHPLLLQSMYIFKQPHIGGEVGWHQDATFLYTQPVSVVGLWMALDDATIENGCMTALAGAHRGPLRRRFQSERGVMAMRVLDETPWPEDAEVAIEAPRGSVVVLHGLLPHASGPNLSARPRHAYSLHLIDATAEYPADNWLQRPDLPLRGFA
jgi:phytanoyl-CoA hydroxylase